MTNFHSNLLSIKGGYQMRNFDETIFSYFQNGYGYEKRLTLSFNGGITLGNADIVSEQFKITQTLCEETSLTFGKVCPAQLYVKIFDTQNTYKGQICTVSLSSYDENDTLMGTIQLGTFTITSDSRTSDKNYRELIGYDALYQLSKYSYLDEWLDYSAQTSKSNLSTFISVFLNDVRLAISCTIDTSYVQSYAYGNLASVKVQGNTGQTTLSYLDMLQMVCEVLGCFAFLDFNGKLRFVQAKRISTQLSEYAFTDNADGSTTDESSRQTSAKFVAYSPSDYYSGGFTYEDFKTANYTQLSIVADLLDGAETEENYTTYTSGTDGVNYTIQQNILTKGWTKTQLGYILTSWNHFFDYKNISYNPCDLQKQYDPRIELGDYIQVTTQTNEVVTFPVLKRVINGIIAMKDDYTATGDEIDGTVGVSISSSSGATVGYAQVDLSNIKGAVITNSLIKDSTITGAKISDSTLTNAHIVDATIDFAKMNSAFVSDLTSDTAFVNELQTNVLTAEFIQSAVADVGYLRAEYSETNQSYSLISTIGQLSADLSLLRDVTITQSGKISGYLDAVEVNANSITAGKLIADYIYLKGDNGLLYQFNIINEYSLIDEQPQDWTTNYTSYYVRSYELTTTEPSDWETDYYTSYYVSDGQGGYTLVPEQSTVPTWQENTYYQPIYTANTSATWQADTFYRYNATPSKTTLDGNAITNRTITADHIVAGTITANEIASGTITADKILTGTITGNKIASNTITASKLNVTTLSAISSNIGTITAGSITGTTISGSSITTTDGTEYVRINNNEGLYASYGSINGLSIDDCDIDSATIGNSTISNATISTATITGLTVGNSFYMNTLISSGRYMRMKLGTSAMTMGVFSTTANDYLSEIIFANNGALTLNATGSDMNIDGLTDVNGTSGKTVAFWGRVESANYFKSTRSDAGFTHEHGTSGKKISFGVGSGGNNRGIYDNTESNWLMYRGSGTGINFGGSLLPGSDGDYNLGGSSYRWNVVCTNALWLFRATSYHFAFGGTPTANRTITFQNASGTVAFTSSDARLKENIKDTDLSGLDMVNKMQIRQFDWIDDESAGYNKGRHQTIGFVADELEELDKYFIVNGSGGYEEDGSINPKCIDTFYLLGYVTKALQELSAKVDELEKKVN